MLLAPARAFPQGRRVRPLVLIALLLLAPDAFALGAPLRLFTFSAGSGLFARPGVGRNGAVYIGSGDGYVHALGADGRFRWSFTVQGRVAAPPVEEPTTGRVFVATSEKKLYALEADAHLRWIFSLPVAPKSELLLTPSGTLLFVGQDDYLYGVTTGGALNLRLAAPGARSAPTWLSTGHAALVLAESLAIVKGYAYERAPLAGLYGPSASLVLAADGRVFSCEEGTAQVLGDDTQLGSGCLAPPVPADGFYAIAEAGGMLRLIDADGSVQSLEVGEPALAPIWDGGRRRLIASTATGHVSAWEVAR